MMTRPTSRHRIIAVVSGLCLCSSFAVHAAQGQADSSSTRPAASVGEDPGAWRRDPFITNMKKGAAPPSNRSLPQKTVAGLPAQVQLHDIHLQGIVQADKGFHALINGRSVKAGDAIGGLTVKEISRFRVVLLNERKEKIIYDIYQGRIDRGKQ